MIWKFLSNIVRFVRYRYLSAVGVTSFQQKGCTLQSKESKDHLLIDKFVIRMMQERDIEIFSWLGLMSNKAFNSVPHDWILYYLKTFGVHEKIYISGVCNVSLVYSVNCEWNILG